VAGITVSIISHRHRELIPALLEELSACQSVSSVIVTRNIPEAAIAFNHDRSSWLRMIDNDTPQGFGANHNQAFKQVDTEYFAVLNPDIRLSNDPFPALIRALDEPGCQLAAPAVVNPAGQQEDSARVFPTFSGLLAKALGRDDGRIHYTPGDSCLPVPWVAGMFMLFRSEDFARLGGFDERFYLYYEDVDLCARVAAAGGRVMLCPSVSVVHDARRESHRNLRFLRWHLASLSRYLYRRYTGVYGRD